MHVRKFPWTTSFFALLLVGALGACTGDDATDFTGPGTVSAGIVIDSVTLSAIDELSVVDGPAANDELADDGSLDAIGAQSSVHLRAFSGGQALTLGPCDPCWFPPAMTRGDTLNAPPGQQIAPSQTKVLVLGATAPDGDPIPGIHIPWSLAPDGDPIPDIDITLESSTPGVGLIISGSSDDVASGSIVCPAPGRADGCAIRTIMAGNGELSMDAFSARTQDGDVTVRGWDTKLRQRPVAIFSAEAVSAVGALDDTLKFAFRVADPLGNSLACTDEERDIGCGFTLHLRSAGDSTYNPPLPIDPDSDDDGFGFFMAGGDLGWGEHEITLLARAKCCKTLEDVVKVTGVRVMPPVDLTILRVGDTDMRIPADSAVHAAIRGDDGSISNQRPQFSMLGGDGAVELETLKVMLADAEGAGVDALRGAGLSLPSVLSSQVGGDEVGDAILTAPAPILFPARSKFKLNIDRERRGGELVSGPSVWLSTDSVRYTPPTVEALDTEWAAGGGGRVSFRASDSDGVYGWGLRIQVQRDDGSVWLVCEAAERTDVGDGSPETAGLPVDVSAEVSTDDVCPEGWLTGGAGVVNGDASVTADPVKLIVRIRAFDRFAAYGDAGTDVSTEMQTWYGDADGDGFGDPDDASYAEDRPEGYVAEGGDCDDSDAEIHPGATEKQDGIDNDCDGEADERTWYLDFDGDGFGDENVTEEDPDQPPGMVAEAGDCDDSDASVHPKADELPGDGIDNDCDGETDEGQTWYRDLDDDGFGDDNDTVFTETQPHGYVDRGGDCADFNPTINPGADEVPVDGVDNDCDGVIDEQAYYQDGDGDGYGNPDVSEEYAYSSQPDGYVAQAGDCNDSDAAIHPGATEVPGDGIDNDCDGEIDEQFLTWYRDADGDSYGDANDTLVAEDQPLGYVLDAADCDDDAPDVHPDAPELPGDGVDNDCDGDVDEETYFRDADGDGYGDPNVTTDTPLPSGWTGNWQDCDDSDADVHPGATEVLDGIDNDCDGTIDEGQFWYRDSDNDGFGVASDSLFAEFQPDGYAPESGDCNDHNPFDSPDADERLDGRDNDCDGEIDEQMWYRDADEDGFGDPGVFEEQQSQPIGYIAQAGDCNDDDVEVHPDATEVLDGIDNDCDGQIDEGFLTWYQDADSDTYGDPNATLIAENQPAGYVFRAGDCDDSDADVHPEALEVADGVDNNCDGEIDEEFLTWYQDFDGDTYGDPNTTLVAQDQPLGYVLQAGDCDDSRPDVHPDAAEVMDGVDNDCDGEIDNDAIDA